MIRTAIKFIKYEKSKSSGILTAIVISIYLIGVELGMFFYLANLIDGVVRNANKEVTQVIVVKRQTENINQLSPFDARWVNQLRSVDGVDNTHPLTLMNVSLKFANGKETPAIVVGSDFPALAAGPAHHLVKDGQLWDLMASGTVSADFHDRKTFGFEVQRGTPLEINGKAATISVVTEQAKGFSTPLLYTTSSKARYYANLPDYMVNAIIVTVNDPNKIDWVVEQINQMTPDLKAWRAEKLGLASVVNVMTANNMGMSFATLIIFGIISGFFIIGLTMYSATYDRIKDYGTLKAIGASNPYITRLVFTQSFIYAVIGFLVSLVLLIITKFGMAKGGLIIRITPMLMLFLFTVTLLISVGSSYFSIKKLKSVEPSSVFR